MTKEWFHRHMHPLFNSRATFVNGKKMTGQKKKLEITGNTNPFRFLHTVKVWMYGIESSNGNFSM